MSCLWFLIGSLIYLPETGHAMQAGVESLHLWLWLIPHLQLCRMLMQMIKFTFTRQKHLRFALVHLIHALYPQFFFLSTVSKRREKLVAMVQVICVFGECHIAPSLRFLLEFIGELKDESFRVLQKNPHQNQDQTAFEANPRTGCKWSSPTYSCGIGFSRKE